MQPVMFFLAEPDEIVEKVALQMGLEPHRVAEQMARWDRIAVETFHPGNDYPRSELH